MECNFIGYALNNKAYRFLALESFCGTDKNVIIESRDAIFYENSFPLKGICLLTL